MDTKLYPAAPFSLSTELAADVGAEDTIIPVSDVSRLPEAPNLATIGMEEALETILYTGKADGALTGCTRGVEGEARAWQAGEPIGRNWTAKDHNDLIAAVQEARNAAEEADTAADAALSAHKSDPAAHEELFADFEGRHRRRVIATRVRDPSKPTYGLGGGEAVVALEVGPLTGAAEVTAIVSGVEYDAKNLSVYRDGLPDGTLILRKVEE